MSGPEGWGAVSLLPTLLVLGLAVLTRRPLEALLAGALFGHLLLSRTEFVAAFLGNIQSVMAEPTSVWVTLVVLLFGVLVGVLARTGGSRAFGEALSRRLPTRRRLLGGAWMLGIVTFVDDYLNALAVGAAFRAAADRFRISRAKLAYVVDSTAAPVCVLIPASTWTVFLVGLFEENGLAGAGEGLSLYLSLIPFLLYPWAALLLVVVVITRLIPDFRGMASAERAAAGGAAEEAAALDESLEPDPGAPPPGRPALRAPAFLIPILTLPVATLLLGGDALFGVTAAIALAVVLAVAVRPPGGFREVAQGAVRGAEEMVYPVGIVLVSFVLRDVNEALGLTGYVIGVVEPLASGWMLPALVFVSLSGVAFATGSFWGTYTVSLPVVVGLVGAVSAPLPVTLGALVSAGAFGSHACLYGDSTVLAAKSSGCRIMTHVRTQLPYALLAAGVATIGFVLLGLLMAGAGLTPLEPAPIGFR